MLNINIKKKEVNEKILFENMKLKLKLTDGLITIWGPSGSGKTTLLNMLLGIDNDYTGNIRYFDDNIKEYNNKELSTYRQRIITCVFQDYKLLDNLSVLENLQLINYQHISDEKIVNVLKILEVDSLVNNKAQDLSGGEKQRVAIARALLMDTQYILFDEPTTGLDDENFQKFINIIDKIKNNKQLIIVTHDQRMKLIDSRRYVLKNKTLILEEKSISLDEMKDIKKNYINKESNFNLLNITKKYKKKILINSFFIVLVLFLFSITTTFLFNRIDSNFQYLYGGVGDNIIVLDTYNLKDEYENNIPDYSTLNATKDRWYWSEQDKRVVSEIPHVQNVTLAAPESNFLADSQGNEAGTISSSDFKLGVSGANAPKNVKFEFKTFPVPSDFASGYYPTPYSEGYGLIYGEYPKDGTDQIMIPDVLATKYVDSTEIESVVGRDINLPIIDGNGEKNEQKYQVSGIYQTEYKKVLYGTYDIYLGYKDAPIMEASQDTYEWLKEDTYNAMSLEGKEYFEDNFKDINSFKSFVGEGMSKLIIKVDDYSSEKEVVLKLQELFPEYQIKSQYDYREGEFKGIYQKIVIQKIIYLVVITLIFATLSLILFKNYYRIRIKEISIIQVLGYRTKRVKLWLLSELIITYLLALLIFVILSFVITAFVTSIFLLIFIILNVIVIYLSISSRTGNKKIKKNIK